MAEYRTIILMGLVLVIFQMHFLLTMPATDCPLDLNGSNFSTAASLCSKKEGRGDCCRYINALIAISISRYANKTGNLGVNSDLSQPCVTSISETLEFYGVTKNATIFCRLGTKIPLNYECLGRTTVTQILQSPRFENVSENCKPPLSGDVKCKKCLNEGVLYLRNLIGGLSDNMILSTCRDATFVALASRVDNVSSADIAGCFFGVQGLMVTSGQPPSLLSPESSPSSDIASSPDQLSSSSPLNQNHRGHHLSLIQGLGIAVIVIAALMLLILIFLIRKKARELEDSDSIGNGLSKMSNPPPKKLLEGNFNVPPRKLLEGPSSMFQKYSYKDMKRASDNFGTVIGQGGFGTVYMAQLRDGLVAAVKRMDKVSDQAEDEFCREIELVAKLHHRHLVALRGFCVDKRERFLVYEYMANGSLQDHLHTPGRPLLSWQTRIQIAIDVANALEYLHFYCDPPLCHRDIKSSNILLDESFVGKVADFGLVHASKDGSICFEPVNTDIRGTPGYMDPEYAVTRELTEKSDVYSYGVVLLELVTSRKAIQDNKNLVEWAQISMNSDSKIAELVDPALGDSFDFDQLQTLVTIIRWCTQGESRARPSIKQVLRLLYECSDPMHSGFVEAVEGEDYDRNEGRERRRRSKGKFDSGDGRCLASSSSTSRSYCSRSFLLEPGSPQSPSAIPSI